MTSQNDSTLQPDDAHPEKDYLRGTDEVNLAELPIATLGRRNRAKLKKDLENTLTFEFRDKEGKKVTWEVSAAKYGLPTEFAERVLVILMALANKQRFAQRRLYFRVYEILKLLDMSRSNVNYRRVDLALKQLAGATIYSDGIFVDKAADVKDYDNSGFGILEYKLTYRETTRGGTTELQRNPTYIDWGERLYRNLVRRYTKPLDLEFYLSLESAIARRLYRILDYKLFEKSSWYRDIFEVSARVGLVRYKMPAEVKRKLKPGADELVERKFLEKWETKRRKHKGKWYTHIIFYKHPDWKPRYEQSQEHDSSLLELPQGYLDQLAQHEVEAAHEMAKYTEYGTTQAEVELWREVQTTLRGKMTKATYDTVFPNSMLLSLKKDTALIGLHNSIAQEWAESRLYPVVYESLQAHLDNEPAGLVFITM